MYAKIVCIFYAYSMQICIVCFVHTLCIIKSNEKKEIFENTHKVCKYLFAYLLQFRYAYFVHTLCRIFASIYLVFETMHKVCNTKYN